MYLFLFILFIALFTQYGISSSVSDGKIYSKKFNKKISKIEDAIRHREAESLEFSNRGKTFTLTIEKGETPKGIKYFTLPFYTYKNIFLNGELVCCLHKIESTFFKRYLVEYSSSRDYYELEELIKCAYKTATKMEKDYWNKNSFSAINQSKSFYK
jgi:hypothetical protein